MCVFMCVYMRLYIFIYNGPKLCRTEEGPRVALMGESLLDDAIAQRFCTVPFSPVFSPFTSLCRPCTLTLWGNQPLISSLFSHLGCQYIATATQDTLEFSC